MTDFEINLKKYTDSFNSFLSEKMNYSGFKGRESAGFEKTAEAMNYSLGNAGKRIRPVLVMAFCDACSGDSETALYYALAVEMIHTYSLIHDDLPCMDNDDFRRGKPSNHKVYGYANALLAGDGLLTMAFEMIIRSELDYEKNCEAVRVLSEAAGPSGMVAGQVMDLDNEDRKLTLDIVRKTDELKTGELIKASCLLGCIAAGANDEMKRAASGYAYSLGLAFQIIDDILDVVGDENTLGKPTGSDEENDKSTYVSLIGLEQAKKLARELTADAVEYADVFGDKGNFIKELANNLLNRNY